MLTQPMQLPDDELEDMLLLGARAVPPTAAATICAESRPRYKASAGRRTQALSDLLKVAAELHRRQELNRLQGRKLFDSPNTVRDYLQAHFAQHEAEAFVVIFLDSQHALLTTEEMFRGTLGQTSVYPREVAKRALQHNAAAVIFAHNHPSGCCEPSRADEALTNALKQSLTLVDVRVLDHVIVGRGETMSFAQRGLL